MNAILTLKSFAANCTTLLTTVCPAPADAAGAPGRTFSSCPTSAPPSAFVVDSATYSGPGVELPAAGARVGAGAFLAVAQSHEVRVPVARAVWCETKTNCVREGSVSAGCRDEEWVVHLRPSW